MFPLNANIPIENQFIRDTSSTNQPNAVSNVHMPTDVLEKQSQPHLYQYQSQAPFQQNQPQDYSQQQNQPYNHQQQYSFQAPFQQNQPQDYYQQQNQPQAPLQQNQFQVSFQQNQPQDYYQQQNQFQAPFQQNQLQGSRQQRRTLPVAIKLWKLPANIESFSKGISDRIIIKLTNDEHSNINKLEKEKKELILNHPFFSIKTIDRKMCLTFNDAMIINIISKTDIIKLRNRKHNLIKTIATTPKDLTALYNYMNSILMQGNESQSEVLHKLGILNLFYSTIGNEGKLSIKKLKEINTKTNKDIFNINEVLLEASKEVRKRVEEINTPPSASSATSKKRKNETHELLNNSQVSRSAKRPRINETIELDGSDDESIPSSNNHQTTASLNNPEHPEPARNSCNELFEDLGVLPSKPVNEEPVLASFEYNYTEARNWNDPDGLAFDSEQ